MARNNAAADLLFRQ